MKYDARGATSINWEQIGMTNKCLLDPGNLANGALSGNTAVLLPNVGFYARVDVVSKGATSSGVINATLEHSDNGSDWSTLHAFDQQGADLVQSKVVYISKPYIRLNGNIGGTSTALKVTALLFY